MPPKQANKFKWINTAGNKKLTKENTAEASNSRGNIEVWDLTCKKKERKNVNTADPFLSLCNYRTISSITHPDRGLGWWRAEGWDTEREWIMEKLLWWSAKEGGGGCVMEQMIVGIEDRERRHSDGRRARGVTNMIQTGWWQIEHFFFFLIEEKESEGAKIFPKTERSLRRALSCIDSKMNRWWNWEKHSCCNDRGRK